MLTTTVNLLVMMLAVTPLPIWYSGDKRCQPPDDNGTYSAPYNALDHRNDYPTFNGADKPGWACSYQREDGVIVQYGDSRSPQQQWLDLWGGNDED
jgi:hypothetical protein